MFLKLTNIWFKNSKFWQGNYHPIVSRPETLYCLNRNQERISMFQQKSTSHSKLYLNPFHRYFENAEKWLSFFSQGHTVTLTTIFLFTQLKFYLETTFHHYIVSLLDMLQSLPTVSTYNVTCFYPLTYVTAEKDYILLISFPNTIALFAATYLQSIYYMTFRSMSVMRLNIQIQTNLKAQPLGQVVQSLIKLTQLKVEFSFAFCIFAVKFSVLMFYKLKTKNRLRRQLIDFSSEH